MVETASKKRKTNGDNSAAASIEEDAALELKCINTIRAFSADMPESAKSGHPGAPMGCAPITHTLFTSVMKYSPSNPKWYNRDRFVLSNGHACALQYTMLYLTGYGLTIEDCKNFRQLGSKTPGHPESFVTSGIEVCTGPLGQGISNAVGIAIAEKHLASVYNTESHEIFSNFTYVLCGDGCLQEGVSSEACSLAGHLGLGKLIVLYDDNQITIDGSTDLSFTEDVGKRYESYGWHVQYVPDVTGSLEMLKAAITVAKHVTDKPSIIKVKTQIGYGSSREGTAKVHGSPLGEEDLKAAKVKYGLDPDKMFQVDDAVQSYYDSVVAENEKKYKEWEALYESYKKEYPTKAAELDRRFKHELPPDIEKKLPSENKDMASRQYSSVSLNAVAPLLPELIGGSADLTGSNLTAIACSGDFQKDTPTGRYLRFGVREHGMSAICNGLFAYGGMRPFCATFLNFAGYALGAMRLSSLSKFGIIYIMTHDSIGLGEDGPTHQPVEMSEILRSTPNCNFYRPADGNEMNAAYIVGLRSVETPTVISCSRSKLKHLEHSSVEEATKGAYITIKESKTPAQLIIIGSGSEMGICIDAGQELNTAGISTRVVSMPCQDVFLQQSSDYQKSVLPGDIPTLSVEAATVYGWHRFSHAQIGMKRFGLSGKGSDCFDIFGFTKDNVKEKGTELVNFYKGRTVPNLMDRPSFDSFKGMEGH